MTYRSTIINHLKSDILSHSDRLALHYAAENGQIDILGALVEKEQKSGSSEQKGCVWISISIPQYHIENLLIDMFLPGYN